MKMKILITGASGLIGTRLTEVLTAKGHSVAHLGRTEKQGQVPSFIWDIKNQKIDRNALADCDTLIHLAGAGIADRRWSSTRKREILESRTNSTQLLFETLKNTTHSIQSFVAASAIGYYGFGDEDKIFFENDLPGKDFLAEVTTQWEKEVDKVSSLGLRLTKIRIGIVLSEKGGALKEMARPIKFGLGAPLGTGNQFLSWIHLDDLCGIFVKAVEDEHLIGPYNAAAAWCTNRAMTEALATTLRKPLWLPPVPAFVLKGMLGEMADMVLMGSKVSSEKIRHAGFQFKFNGLEEAILDFKFKL